MKIKNENQAVLVPKLEKNEGNLDLSELQEMANNVSKTIFIDNKDTSNTMETFFVRVIDKLFSRDDISLKTEYVNEDEQFCGTKLDYLINYGGFQLAKGFLEEWEVKRVSLGRKSRQEIIVSLWEKEKERIRQEQAQMNRQIGM